MSGGGAGGMRCSGAFAARLSAWAPGVEGAAEWDEWARGARPISPGAKGPEVAFADPMLRRRLSRVSKMAMRAAAGLMPIADGAKLFFASFRGELARQLQINSMLAAEGEVGPAAFSLSVFNAPAALATMALGLKGGYAALYPAGDSFAACLDAAEAALFSGAAEELAFVYADEEAPPEYAGFSGECPEPAAFGLLLSKSERPGCAALSDARIGMGEGPPLGEPLAFLRRLLLGGLRASG